MQLLGLQNQLLPGQANISFNVGTSPLLTGTNPLLGGNLLSSSTFNPFNTMSNFSSGAALGSAPLSLNPGALSLPSVSALSNNNMAAQQQSNSGGGFLNILLILLLLGGDLFGGSKSDNDDDGGSSSGGSTGGGGSTVGGGGSTINIKGSDKEVTITRDDKEIHIEGSNNTLNMDGNDGQIHLDDGSEHTVHVNGNDNDIHIGELDGNVQINIDENAMGTDIHFDKEHIESVEVVGQGIETPGFVYEVTTKDGETFNVTVSGTNFRTIENANAEGIDKVHTVHGNDQTIELTDLNDEAKVTGTGNTINFGDGDDTYRGFDDENSTINMGAGNDDIRVASDRGHTVDLGDGDDFVGIPMSNPAHQANAEGGKVTEIRGGEGTDTVRFGANRHDFEEVEVRDDGARVYREKTRMIDGREVAGNTIIIHQDVENIEFQPGLNVDGNGKSFEIDERDGNVTLSGNSHRITVSAGEHDITVNGRNHRITLNGGDTTVKLGEDAGNITIDARQATGENTIEFLGDLSDYEMYHSGDTLYYVKGNQVIRVIGKHAHVTAPHREDEVYVNEVVSGVAAADNRSDNRDGIYDREELQSYRDWLAQDDTGSNYAVGKKQAHLKAMDLILNEDNFAKADLNGDGRLSGGELSHLRRTIAAKDGDRNHLSQVDFDRTSEPPPRNERITVTQNDQTVRTGRGHDRVTTTHHRGNIHTGAGSDFVDSVGSTANRIYTGDGNDFVRLRQNGSRGNQDTQVFTGAGNDHVQVGFSVRDRINTGAGNDHIYFNSQIGRETEVRGGAGNDTVTLWGNRNQYEFSAPDANGFVTAIRRYGNTSFTFRIHQDVETIRFAHGGNPIQNG